MKYKDQKCIAREYVRTAIELYFEKKFASAVTLAGAAEEILGRIAEERDVEPILKHRTAIAREAGWIPADKAGETSFTTVVNRARNSAKHRRDAGEIAMLAWKVEAEDLIGRALSNYLRATGEIYDGPMRRKWENRNHRTRRSPLGNIK